MFNIMTSRYARFSNEKKSVRANSPRECSDYIPPPRSRQKLLLATIIGSSFLLIIISLFCSSKFDYNLLLDGSRNDLNFGAVVDCGSTGTRAHIFKWSSEGDSATTPRIELLRDELTGIALTKHITPGLSSLQNEPHRASDYMEPIMQFICDSVPSIRHPDTPVYFMATAGLRLLDADVQKEILTDITTDLKAKFNFPHIRSQVITGEHEGIYSWLSLNLDKIYDNLDKPFRYRSMGMIEVGGASMQVAFEITPEVENSIRRNLKHDDAISAFRNEQVSVSLSDMRDVKLFVATYLGLGVNSARDLAVDLLVMDYLNVTIQSGTDLSVMKLNDYEITLSDPCLAPGSSEVVMRPIELAVGAAPSLVSSQQPHKAAFKVRLQGSGNFRNCSRTLERVLQYSKSSKLNCPPDKKSCPMDLLGEKFIPYQHFPFAGLSEMFFTTNEMIISSGEFDRSRVLTEAQDICSSSYANLIERYSQSGLIKNQDRILHQCFRTAWLLSLLDESGLGMPTDYEDFHTMEQLDGREIDWTMGAFVSEIALNDRGSP